MVRKGPWDIKEGDLIPWKAIKLKDEILRAYKLLYSITSGKIQG